MKYIKFLFSTLLTSAILFAGIVWGIICVPRNTFDTSYQSIIQEKFAILRETNDPKIIIVSGSSSAFGLNQKMLEDATGYKVANLGLHAGFSYLFCSELAKANINKGDIVLLGYEYNWYQCFDLKDTNLIMSGIDDNIEIYHFLPAKIWSSCLGNLFTFAAKKNSYIPTSGIYSRESFDLETGQMNAIRDSTILWNADLDGTVDLRNTGISSDTIEYLKDFKAFIESNGASVYFICPPLLADSIACDYSEFTRLIEIEEAEIGIKYISDPTQYFFPDEWMFDTIYHCNNIGEDMRTKILIEDLKRAFIIP